LTKKQVLNVFFDHVSFSNLRNSVGAVDSFNLLLIVLMAERSQESNRMEGDERSFSNDDNLLEV